MKRITILADEDLLLEAQQLAAERGTSFTAIVQEALRAYLAMHRPRRTLSFIAAGRSGQPYPVDAESGWEETVLAQSIDPAEGWSVDRQKA